ncbi:MAG TPA: hypothetical protein PLQ85_12255 [Anaerolineae bacterium]|nr:hypothetical protein [Anaerolineae bacterium]
MSAQNMDEWRKLATALQGLDRPRVSEAARARIWQAALAQAASPRRSAPAPFFRALARGIAIGVLLIAGAFWILWRSAPGDALYPVARELEARGRTLAPAGQQSFVELQVLNRRAAEVQRLVQRDAEVPQELIAELARGANKIAAEPEAWGGASAVATVERQVSALQLAAATQPANRQTIGALEMAVAALNDVQRATTDQ